MRTLAYGRARSSRIGRGVLFAIFVPLLAVVVLLVPVHRVHTSEICLVCADRGLRSTTAIAGWKCRNHVTIAPYYPDYSDLTGTPHQHQWVIAGITSAHGNLWIHGGGGCGGPYPEAKVALLALQAMRGDDFKELPIETRRAIYIDLASSTSVDEVRLKVEKLSPVARRARRNGGVTTRPAS